MTPMDERPFVETLAAAQRGDADSFAALFRLAQPAVLRYLQAIAGPRAEDIAGDTWVQVVRGLDGFSAQDPAAFRGWVISIARHRWLDDQRSRRRRPESLVDEVPERPVADVASTVTDLISTEDAVALIGRLPTDQAEVLMLRVVADLDVTATASILGKQPGAVRVLAHRGLRRLRQLVDPAEPRTTAVTRALRRSVSE
jgi:RNA polymerase sigma-70 factor (ECF subfamily)